MYRKRLLYNAMRRYVIVGKWAAADYLNKHHRADLLPDLERLIAKRPWFWQVRKLSNGHCMLVYDDLNGSRVAGIFNFDMPYTGMYNNGKEI